MQKKWVLSFLLAIISCSIFAFDESSLKKSYQVGPEMYIDFDFTSHSIAFTSNNDNWRIDPFEGHYIITESEGLSYIKIKGTEGEKVFGILSSSDKLILYDLKSDAVMFASYVKDKTRGVYNNFDFLYGFKSSSYFSEEYGGKVYHYESKNLETWTPRTPWVEGSEDDGVGEWLTFRSGSPSTRSLYIINGFYDPSRPYLYKQNNRLKEFRISAFTDESYNTLLFQNDYMLEDIITLHEIKFPGDYKYFKLEILSVYEGSKYNDTCITGIYTDRRIGY